MATSTVETIVEQFKSLPPAEQIKVAEVIDRLTWAQRWHDICRQIEIHRQHMPPVSDDQVDEAVRQVRQEKPLSARSSTPPSSSAR